MNTASELIKLIEEFKLRMKSLSYSEQEQAMIDWLAFNNFISSLEQVVDIRRQPIYEQSAILSNRKSRKEDHLKFYNRTEDMIDEPTRSLLMSKINQLISCYIPVLELFPAKGQFTKLAVSAEPLYIADYFQESLEEVGSLFNSFYANRRLVKVLIEDFTLPNIPKNQIGLCFCFNYFMVKDQEFIVHWAKEVFKVLKPGGSFIFNFIPNNSEGTQMAENNLVCLVNTEQLMRQLTDIGFDIIDYTSRSGFGSTIEATKPGEQPTVKFSSILAKIIDKSEPLV
jgi:SAM-dependent methyltransferase